MTNMSEERLLAWLDGELDAADAEEVARAVAADPALAERARRERALRARLRGAFAPVADEAPPQRLLEVLGMAQESAAKPQDTVVPLRARATATPARRWRWPEWTALAASLLLGVLFGAQFARPQGPVRMQDGALVAGTGLARVLDTQLAADARPGAALAAGMSFRDGEGRYCRTFLARGEQVLGGLACHGGGRWNVVALGEAENRQGELRQAASGLPASVLAEVDARQVQMLDAAAERAARDAGWR